MGEVICIDGWNRKRAASLKGWLDASPERYLVFIDPDPLHILEPKGHDRIHVIPPTTESYAHIVLTYIYFPFFYEGQSANLLHLESVHQEINHQATDYADRGIQLFCNMFSNLKKTRYGIGDLFFDQKPAIVCGAGPSLKKNGHLLKKHRSKAIVFAGGAAIKALKHYEVEPHLAAHNDPHPTHRFEQSNLPTLYQLRTSSKLLESCSGSLILVGGSGNSPLENWAQKQLGISSESFDSGWTVGTFCIAVAASLGCNPIILVGMDLSTDRRGEYAPGVDAKAEQDRLILIKGSHQKPLWARPDWNLAAQWIEEFALKHPKIRLINATEGGRKFCNVEEMPLAEVEFGEDMEVSLDAIQTLEWSSQSIEKSIALAKDYVTSMLFECEKIFPKSPHDSNSVALALTNLHAELIYQNFLKPVWTIWERVIARNPEIIASPVPWALFLNELFFYQTLLNQIESYACQSTPRN